MLFISCFWMEYTSAQMYKYISYFSRSVTVLTLQLICLSKNTSSAGVMSGCHHEKMLQSLHPAAICRAEITNVNVFFFFFSLSRKMHSVAFVWTFDRRVVLHIIIKSGFKQGWAGILMWDFAAAIRCFTLSSSFKVQKNKDVLDKLCECHHKTIQLPKFFMCFQLIF